jgi:DNA-binding NtrC family response regulator
MFQESSEGTEKVIKVLIVDNEAKFSDSLESFIKDKGHEAFTAKGIMEAIFLLEKEEPHLVFLDLLFLSTPSGLTLIERMKAAGKKRKIYLICDIDRIGKELPRQIRVDGMIFKPFQMAEIGNLIDKACEELE